MCHLRYGAENNHKIVSPLVVAGTYVCTYTNQQPNETANRTTRLAPPRLLFSFWLQCHRFFLLSSLRYGAAMRINMSLDISA